MAQKYLLIAILCVEMSRVNKALPVESQVVLRENTPESRESLEDNSAKNFDLCRQLLSDLRSRFDETFGVSGNIRRLTRKSGDVGL
jgi:hypothetical protein